MLKNVCNSNSVINKSEMVLMYSHNQKFSTYDNIRGVTFTAMTITRTLSNKCPNRAADSCRELAGKSVSVQRPFEISTRHPPPATRHPPPVTPQPATRHPPPVEKTCRVETNKLSLSQRTERQERFKNVYQKITNLITACVLC